MLTLYTTPLSANGRKVLAVCRHLGLAPEVNLVNVYAGEGRTPEYLAINPLGKVPALIDGDLKLTESNAILLYLSEGHAGYALSSRDPKRRAEIVRWMFWEAAHWQPAFYPILGPFVAARVVPGMPAVDASEVNWNDAAFEALAQHVDQHLRQRSYLAGGELTLADFAVAAMLMYARPARFPFDRLGAVAAWYGRIEALDAWRATAVGPWAY